MSIDDYGNEIGRIKAGERYRFDYPAAFTGLPEYTAHAGQIVTAVRQLDEAENDFNMWRFRCTDDWEGDAFQDELVEV